MWNWNSTKMRWRRLRRLLWKRKTGARGLRAIMENVMMDIMYKAPSDENLKYCLVTKEAVLGEKALSTEKNRSKTGKCIRKSDVWKWVLTVKARSIHFYLTGEKTI